MGYTGFSLEHFSSALSLIFEAPERSSQVEAKRKDQDDSRGKLTSISDFLQQIVRALALAPFQCPVLWRARATVKEQAQCD
jgi:hypothetical protein